MKRAISISLCLVTFSGLSADVRGQGAETPPGVNTQQENNSDSAFALRGLFDAGIRWSDVSGNNAKYREDLNYGTGPRLFNLDLSLSPTGDGPVDVAQVFAHGLGDPYESLGFTLKKFDRFTLRYRRNTSAYFYRDTTLPVEEASVSASSAGDFHHFGFDRQNDRLGFEFKVAPRSKAFFNFNRQTRLGSSTTTLDISRDEFELDQPLNETKNDYTVGLQTAWPRVSFYLDHTYRDYENDRRIFLPGASVGENPADSTETFFYEQLLPFDFTMPQTTVKVNARPTARLTVTGGVIYSDLTADFSHSEESRGVSFTGTPFDSVATSQGALGRQTTLVDLDLAYDLTAHVALIGGVRSGRFDQESMLVGLEPNPTQVATGVDISTTIVEAGAQVFPRSGVTLTGGLRSEQRDTEIFEDDTLADRVETTRATYFVNGVIRPARSVSVLGEYERGTYDNPFTLVAPTTLDRVKLRARLRPLDGLTLTSVFHAQRIENDVAGPTLGPTVARSSLTGAASDPTSLDTTDITVHATYSRDQTSVFGGYTRREVSNEVRNRVTTSPGFLGGQVFDFLAIYQSDVDRLFAGTWLDVTDRFGGGVDISHHRNRGSFGLDWKQYRLSGEFRSPAGYLVRTTYQYNALNEMDVDFDDYRSHIVTVSVGYRFR